MLLTLIADGFYYLESICHYLITLRICPKLTGKETNLFAKGLEVQIQAPDDIFLRVGGGLCVK